MSDSDHPLLELQRRDVALEQIRHRRETLPELAAVAEATASLAELERRDTEVRRSRGALEGRMAALEAELASVEAKFTKLEGNLYGGAITSPKDAMLAQDELNSLASRRSTIEDDILALLDELGPSDDLLASIATERETLLATRASSQEAVGIRFGELDAERENVVAERSTLVADVPVELVNEYEVRRGEFGTSAAVVFVAGRCVGCPSAMPAVEVDRIRRLPSGSSTTCTECGRIVLT